jgi:hypothetical protein
MTFYSDMATTADELITEFGQTVTLKVSAGAAYDPETGSSVVTYTDQSGHGCVVDFDKKLIDGTKVRIGDKLVLLSPLGISEPKDGDQLVIGAETWQLVPPVTVTAPAGVAVLYEVQVRK